MHRTWILVVILGCAGGAKPAQTTVANGGPAPADPQSCAKVADHLIDLMSANAKDAPPEAIKHVHDVVLARCDQDQWTPEARQCFMAVSDRKGGERCNQMLSEAQRSAIEQAMGGGGDRKEQPEVAPAASAPPLQPSPAAPGGTRGPKSNKGGDPCEGGE